MFKTLFIHGLQSYIYSLRFQVSFIILLFAFVFGTISYIVLYTDTNDNYIRLIQEQEQEMEKKAENATLLAVSTSNYILKPKANAIIDDCRETMLPNKFTYNAYNVFGFDVRTDSTNPLLEKVQGISWAFIISILLSFVTLLFAFDAVSGEKESKTLALVFSNPVSRALFIVSKFASIVITMLCITIIGIIFSLLIITFSGKITVNAHFLTEIAGFILSSLLLVSVMAVIGLLASSLFKQSNVSLLTCLTVWIFFAVVLPNSSMFVANKIFSIPPAKDIQELINRELADINKNAPHGSWSSHGTSNPFFPPHQLRANNQTNLMNAEKRHRDAYYNQMFQQFEKTRMLSIISPIAQFEGINEGILDGGYLRFQKNWKNLHYFQESFLKWFKDFDAKDPNSPHWYNPYENISTTLLPASVEQIPRYVEKPSTLVERISYMRNYLLAILVTFGGIFAVCFNRFLRYDVR